MKNITCSIHRITLFAVLLVLGFQIPASAAEREFSRIFVFGDSLSDAGNVFASTGEITQTPWPLVPDRPYDIGGYQFSNGKTWAQHFARHMQTNYSGNAALFEPGHNGNFAFGGARARPVMGDPNTAQTQLDLYMGFHGVVADREALYVIQFGGNDLRDALVQGDPTIVGQAVASQIDLIKQLYYQGARRFLVANSGDIGLTPAVKLAGDEAAAFASGLTAIYNFTLEGHLQLLESEFDDIEITRLNFFDIINTIISEREQYGIENITGTCLMFLPPATGICEKHKTYMFWDGIHPTRTVHRIVGEIAAGLYE